MTELTTILTDVRMLLATVFLAFGSCLQVGCSDANKTDQWLEAARQANAEFTINTPLEATFSISVLNNEILKVGAGNRGTGYAHGSFVGAADRMRRPSPVTPLEPVLGCMIPEANGGGCDLVVPSVCGRMGGTVVPNCPQ